MAWSARRKAAAFSAVLILVSTGFIVSAAAGTGGVLEPLRRGEDYASERPLTRHGVALAVIVGSFADGERVPVSGAHVAVSRLAAADTDVGVLVAEKDTNAEGRAVFQLRPGPYRVDVTWDESETSEVFRLHESQRVWVFFDEAGEATWHEKAHRDLERRGEHVGLLVRVVQNGTGERMPVAGANVTVYRPPEDRGSSREVVASAETGERGFAGFALRPGQYVVVVTWGDETSSQTVNLRRDSRVVFQFDGDPATPGRP